MAFILAGKGEVVAMGEGKEQGTGPCRCSSALIQVVCYGSKTQAPPECGNLLSDQSVQVQLLCRVWVVQCGC